MFYYMFPKCGLNKMVHFLALVFDAICKVMLKTVRQALGEVCTDEDGNYGRNQRIF